MKFKYKKYGPDVLRPVIPVGISVGDKAVMYEVLVDSGADICIFDAEIGEVIGLDIEGGEPHMVKGVTGAPQAYYVHDVTLFVGGWKQKIKAGFMPRLGADNYGIVGQIGFFDRYVVKFEYDKETIELKAAS